MRFCLLPLALVIGFAAPARAQQPPKAPQPGATQPSAKPQPGTAPKSAPETEEGRRAETLFNEGREALAQGDTTVACAKFEESIALVRAAGTVFNLAQCEEQRGHLLEAIRKWKDGVSLVPDGDDRVGPANERIAVLEAKVPQLKVDLGADVSKKAEVRVNSDLIDRSALATPLRLNPGSYAVTLSAAKKESVVVQVQLAEGDKKTVDLAFPAEPKTNPRRIIGFAVGGLGLAALAVTGITGIVILVRDGEIDDECPKGACTLQGYRDVESNRSLIAVNWVAFGLGVVATGVGAYLVLTSPSNAQAAPPKTGIGVGNVAGGAGISAWRSF